MAEVSIKTDVYKFEPNASTSTVFDDCDMNNQQLKAACKVPHYIVADEEGTAIDRYNIDVMIKGYVPGPTPSEDYVSLSGWVSKTVEYTVGGETIPQTFKVPTSAYVAEITDTHVTLSGGIGERLPYRTQIQNLTFGPDVTIIPSDYIGYNTSPNSLVNLDLGHVTKIGYFAFDHNETATKLVLPEELTELNASAFGSWTALTELTIPAATVSINGNSSYGGAFQNCTALKTVTFKGTPTTLYSGTFTGCTAVTDIYVPWAEGDIAGAPWGATNATVHYETT